MGPPFFTAEIQVVLEGYCVAKVLQWGRRSSRRRSRPVEVHAQRGAVASMGPPFFTAEIAFGAGCDAIDDLLQWGRRSSRRRSCRQPWDWDRQARLQWGRRSSRRRSRRQCTAIDPFARLQWGRRSSRRRSSGSHGRWPWVLVASMGPPFFTAEIVDERDEARAVRALQWGRRSSRRRSRDSPTHQ